MRRMIFFGQKISIFKLHLNLEKYFIFDIIYHFWNESPRAQKHFLQGMLERCIELHLHLRYQDLQPVKRTLFVQLRILKTHRRFAGTLTVRVF